MSYRLSLYKRSNNPLTSDQVAQYIIEHIPTIDIADAQQWRYDNPSTGVKFLITWTAPENGNTCLDGFESLDVCFRIALVKPRFYAYEVFPLIEQLINHLDLYLVAASESADADAPQQFASGYLAEQWMSHSDARIRDGFDSSTMDYLEVEKSDYLWHYHRQKEALQERLTDAIFIPKIMEMKNKGDEKLYTACVWPQHMPIVLPKVDFVIVTKQYKRFLSIVKKGGVVPYTMVTELFADAFEAVNYESTELLYLSPAKAKSIEKAFNAMKLILEINDFTKVAPDGYVNLRP